MRPAEYLLVSQVRLTRSGRAMRLVGEGGPPPVLDPALVRLLAQARRYWRELKQGEIDISRLAAREGVSGSWLTRVLRLAFLSPALVDAVLAGRQPAGMTAGGVIQPNAINAWWEDQAGRLGCRPAA